MNLLNFTEKIIIGYQICCDLNRKVMSSELSECQDEDIIEEIKRRGISVLKLFSAEELANELDTDERHKEGRYHSNECRTICAFDSFKK